LYSATQDDIAGVIGPERWFSCTLHPGEGKKILNVPENLHPRMMAQPAFLIRRENDEARR
jgi:hypothetical protein